MDINEYQKNALRTESVVDQVKVNYGLLHSAFEVFVECSKLLDALKRSIYYGNDDRLNEWLTQSKQRDFHNTAQRLVNSLELGEDVKVDLPVDGRVLHGIMGICTEAGEIGEAYMDQTLEDKPLDSVNIHEEMHDISWYMAILHDALNLGWKDGLEKNINKLKARFPNKFTQEDAVNRDLEKERKTLED